MYIGITVGLIGFLAIVTVIAIAISEEDFVAIITPIIFICICVIAIVFLVNSDEPTHIKTTNVAVEKSVVTATVKWEGQPLSKGSKHKVNMTIVDPDGVVLEDHTFTVMYNGKKEFHLSIGVDESIVSFIDDNTDKVIVDTKEKHDIISIIVFY